MQLAAHVGGVEGGGQPLAPRGGAQPGEIDHVGILRERARLRDRLARLGLVDRVQQHRLHERQQLPHDLVVAVG